MARFIFLGTGSIGNLGRASISFALDLGDEGVLLIDTCSGREVLRQLKQAGIAYDRIHYIYITHQHGDHAGGLGLVLMQMIGHTPGVTLWTPQTATLQMRKSIDIFYQGIVPALGKNLTWKSACHNEPIKIGSSVELTPFATEHSVPALGCRLALPNSTIAYAADTGPAQGVIDATKGVDILIHEASGSEVEAEGATMAHMFGHSTAGDAGRVAAAAGVGQLYLVHHMADTPEAVEQLRDEAQQFYTGPVHIPNDFDTLDL